MDVSLAKLLVSAGLITAIAAFSFFTIARAVSEIYGDLRRARNAVEADESAAPDVEARRPIRTGA